MDTNIKQLNRKGWGDWEEKKKKKKKKRLERRLEYSWHSVKCVRPAVRNEFLNMLD